MTQKMIGLIGGSGLGDWLAARLEDVVLEDMDTPFGKPSAPVMMGRLGSTQVAFLARHGVGHRYSPGIVLMRRTSSPLKNSASPR
jgi:purine nucleoside phosphorylase